MVSPNLKPLDEKYLKMKRVLVFTSFMLCAGFCLAQSPAQPELPQTPSLLKESNPTYTEGTFQFILKDRRMVEPPITNSILNLVNSNRKQTEVSYVTIDAYTEIKILPLVEINAPTFTPIKTYVYEN